MGRWLCVKETDRPVAINRHPKRSPVVRTASLPAVPWEPPHKNQFWDLPTTLDKICPEMTSTVPATKTAVPGQKPKHQWQLRPDNLQLFIPEQLLVVKSTLAEYVFHPCKNCKTLFGPPSVVVSACGHTCTSAEYCSVRCHRDSLRACRCDIRRPVCPCRECKGSDCEVRLCFSSRCSLLACSGCSGKYCSQTCKGGTLCDLCHRSECESCTLRCPTCGAVLCSDCGKDGCLHCRLGPHEDDCKNLHWCYCCGNYTCRCRVRLDAVGYHLCEECANDANETCEACQIERERSKLYRS